MRALRSHVCGGPETLTLDNIEPPIAKPGQVIVRVAVSALNYPDALVIEDRYQLKPARPFSPGGELAGVVETVGEGVTGFAPGDRVMAKPGIGALAELVAVDAVKCFAIPDAMPFDEAAAFLFTYGTTIHALTDRARLMSGETMLVLGAAGGVGSAAIELGKAFGARVIAAVSSSEKADVARRLGADDVVIYGGAPVDLVASKALSEQFKLASAPKGFDVIYDPVGGAYAEPALRAIGWEGRYVVVGFTAGIPTLALNLTLLKACDVVGVFWGAWANRNPRRCAEQVAILMRLWSEGRIRPLISARVSLADAPEAIARMSKRGTIGKTIVDLLR